MRVVFARHGESEANLAGVFSNRGSKHSLTTRGRQQALELAACLAEESFDRILASPVMRATQTAEILGVHFRVPVEIIDELREFDAGKFEGTSDPEGWNLHRDVMARWARGESSARMPGGESLLEIVDRLSRFLSTLAESAKNDAKFLLVGHGGLYVGALPHVLADLNAQFCLEHHLRNCDVVVAEGECLPLRCVTWAGIRVGSQHCA